MNLLTALHARKSDRGETIIEFTLATVMLVILLLSVVEMGRMVLVYNTVANAARAGVRYAVVHGGDRTGSGANGPSGSGSTTQVQTVVKDFAGAANLTPANLSITVSYPDGGNDAGSRVSVAVQYAYDPLVSYFISMLSVNMSSTSEGVIAF
jgi:Flp pilus assembly protein TadG